MTSYGLIQTVVLTLILIGSVYYAWRKVMPAHSSRLLTGWSMALRRPGRSRFSQRLGNWLKPPVAAAAGCDSGCSSCNGCATEAPSGPPQAVPLTFHRQRP